MDTRYTILPIESAPPGKIATKDDKPASMKPSQANEPGYQTDVKKLSDTVFSMNMVYGSRRNK
ncbi:MAG: hypothetical protein OHK0029_01840 [Armatimonadaceae bacterium]